MTGERAHIVQAGATVQIGGSSIGFTSGPSVLTHTIETSDILANQSHGVIKSVKTTEHGKLTFGALEMVRENLLKFFETSQAVETDGNYRRVHVGGDQDITERTIVLYTRAEDDKTRKITCHICVRDGDVEYTMGKENATIMGLTYKLLMKLSLAEGKQLFEIEDDTATAYNFETGL